MADMWDLGWWTICKRNHEGQGTYLLRCFNFTASHTSPAVFKYFHLWWVVFNWHWLAFSRCENKWSQRVIKVFSEFNLFALNCLEKAILSANGQNRLVSNSRLLWKRMKCKLWLTEDLWSCGCVGNILLPWFHCMMSSPEGNARNWDVRAFVQWEFECSFRLHILTNRQHNFDCTVLFE